MRVYFQKLDEQGCGHYRAEVPKEALRTKGYNVDTGMGWGASIIKDYDVIILHKPYQKELLDFIRDAKAFGKRVLFEVDDNLWNLHPSNPGYQHWGKPDTLEVTDQLLRECNGVIISTEYLKTYVDKLNKNVYVCPNHLPKKYWKNIRHNPTDGITVGWSASLSHRPDFSMIESSVYKVLDKYPKVKFIFAGIPDLPLKKHDRIMTSCVVKPKDVGLICSAFDIGLAPVIVNEFNRSKSDLKFLEYGATGVAGIYTDIEAYNTVEDRVTGLVIDNSKWFETICELIDNKSLREKIGINGRKYARTRFAEDNTEQWEHAIRG